MFAVILPDAASLRAASQLRLRSEPSQQKVCLVVAWFKQKHCRPWSSGQEPSTSQLSRGKQERGFTSCRAREEPLQDTFKKMG